MSLQKPQKKKRLRRNEGTHWQARLCSFLPLSVCYCVWTSLAWLQAKARPSRMIHFGRPCAFDKLLLAKLEVMSRTFSIHDSLAWTTADLAAASAISKAH
jgi:hypothetical protein